MAFCLEIYLTEHVKKYGTKENPFSRIFFNLIITWRSYYVQ